MTKFSGLRERIRSSYDKIDGKLEKETVGLELYRRSHYENCEFSQGESRALIFEG